MTASDPSIPLFALLLSVITFALGYLAGRIHRRWAANRHSSRYASIITPSR